jgi:hypothetical protein
VCDMANNIQRINLLYQNVVHNYGH